MENEELKHLARSRSSRKLPQIVVEASGSHGHGGEIVELKTEVSESNLQGNTSSDKGTDARESDNLVSQDTSSVGLITKEIDPPDNSLLANTSQEINPVTKECGSVAYISETLIKQLTKEERFDMITSLTIHFHKDKLNKKIKYIENLEKLKRLQILNLSNNMIEKMQKLETLSELRELNLSSNCIKVIECLDNMTKLEVLNLSGNQLTSIPRLAMKKLRCLKVLKLSHNKIESLLEITKLRPLQDLTNLDVQGNPFSALPHSRQFVIYQLRSLHVLDNQTVTTEERQQADTRFSQEEVQRLEVEVSKHEKLYRALEDEKNKANATIEQLMKTQNSLKEKEKRQTGRIVELEQDIEAKSALVKAKNADLIKASEKQYRLEQELAFYKLDAKFELLGEMPLIHDNMQMDEQGNLDDSTYIGKATFMRNEFDPETNKSGEAEQTAHATSLEKNNEELKKIGARLDQMLYEKNEALRQLQRLVDDKNCELRDVSERLTSLELTLAGKMAKLGQGDDLLRKQLAEKIDFIKRLQAAAQELEARMKTVANEVEEKQRQLGELGRDKDRLHCSGGYPQLEQALRSKEAELHEAHDKLSKMKEDLELLNQQIADGQTEVERLRRELGEVSQEPIELLKKELEGVILALNKRLEELQNLAKEQQARIKELEQEREDLSNELGEEKDTREILEQKIQYSLVALANEERKSQEAEERANELQDRLLAFEKNNTLGLREADVKLKQADKEIERLKRNVEKSKVQLETERAAASARVERDQERIGKALEAAKGLGEKEQKLKELALQVNALQATNEALKDRLHEAEHELKRKSKDARKKDDLSRRLDELLHDLDQGRVDVRQPYDETDSVGGILAGLHRKYLDLMKSIEKERAKGKRQQKQAKAAVDELKRELARAQSQLKAAENGLAELSEDVARKENELHEVEGEMERLRTRFQQPSEKHKDEVNHVRALAKKQKDRLEKEIQELQAELQELQDKHFDELRRKEDEIAELEAMLSEHARHAVDEEEKERLRRDLEGLKRLLSDRVKASKERLASAAQRKMDESRRRIEADLRNAEQKIESVENLVKEKQRDNTCSHGNNIYRHYPDTSSAEMHLGREKRLLHDHQGIPPVTPMNEEHHYHHGNNTAIPSSPHGNMSAVPHADIIHHHHHDNTALQTPLDESAATTTTTNHHHHYGNGVFTRQLKKKNTREKEYCNVSEHEYLESDIISLEEKLTATKSKLSSQKTENSLNALRSDLRNLEHTVSDSVRERAHSKGIETHLDETLAKLQDHMLTLMDHRANLLSQNTT